MLSALAPNAGQQIHRRERMTQSQPPEPMAPGAGAPKVAWSSPTRQETPVPGAAGLVYADVPNRVIALIIDAIVLGLITFVVTAVLYSIIGSPISFTLNSGFGVNYVSLIIGAIVSLVISAVYYVYTWTTMRASPGMRALGMQVGNFPDGATLTQEQAIRRWAALFGPFAVSQVVYVAPTIGGLVGLLTFAYAIYLLYTTAKSPTKQGFHDVFANTVVVKAARTV
jgi:uncharacterized RDD family membrane protein YckC